jgi:hypothetical protein
MRDLVDRIGNLGHDCDIVGQLLARSKSVRSRPSHLNALLKLGESESSLILRRDEPKLRSAEPIPDVLPLPRQGPEMHKQMKQPTCRLRW